MAGPRCDHARRIAKPAFSRLAPRFSRLVASDAARCTALTIVRAVPPFPEFVLKTPALASLMLLSPALVLAQQDTPPMPGSNNQQLERVEIRRTLSDTDLRRRAPVAKQVFGREELDKYGDTNVADVLKRLPGVNVSGGAPRMRGLGSGYTLILINGDPAPPGFQLDQLDPKQVERIEVTKGPTADQSAQAVAGAINIILKDAPRVSQRDLRLGLGYNVDRPTPAATLTFGEKIGSAALSVPVSVFSWRNLGETTTTRHVVGDGGATGDSVQKGEQLNWGHGVNTTPRLNWRISEDETLTLMGFGQQGWWNNRLRYDTLSSTGIASSGLDDDANNKGTWQMLRGNVQWNNRFSETQKVELKAGMQRAKGSFNNQTVDTSTPVLSLGDNLDRNFTQAGKYSQLLGDDHSLTVGWDLEWRRRDETRTTTVNGQSQLPQFDGETFGARIQRQAFFVQDEWEISPQWSTYLGLRNERIVTTSRGNALDARNVSSVLTPLWHLNYKLDPKGRDLIRGSITRSYKAPDLSAMLGRYSLNSKYPSAAQTNEELYPDRVGNPLLKPELATGLDIAYEKYFTGGGMFSVAFFHRDIKDLIRNATSREVPAGGTVARYVSRPVNLSKAQTSGIELELKGRASELLPALFDPKTALNLRGSVSFYHSRVEALPGPDNRLDGQQPWSGNLGFDYRLASLPLTTGANLGFTPGYATRQTLTQVQDQSRNRSLDLFAQWVFNPKLSLRVSANNLAPLNTQSLTTVSNGSTTFTDREARTWYGVNLEMKL